MEDFEIEEILLEPEVQVTEQKAYRALIQNDFSEINGMV